MVPLFGAVFDFMMGWMTENRFSTVVLSNFPGPPALTYFIGAGGSHRVTDMNFSAGIGPGNAGNNAELLRRL